MAPGHVIVAPGQVVVAPGHVIVASGHVVVAEHEAQGAEPAGFGEGHSRPFEVRVGTLGIAFLAFAAVGGFVPGGLAGDGKALTAVALVATIALDVVIGGLAGYRIAALRLHTWREGVVAMYQYAVASGHIGGFLRVLALPRLFGPALLTLLLYLVTGFRESPTPIRRSRRLIEESGLLVLAGAAAVVWGLLAK